MSRIYHINCMDSEFDFWKDNVATCLSPVGGKPPSRTSRCVKQVDVWLPERIISIFRLCVYIVYKEIVLFFDRRKRKKFVTDRYRKCFYTFIDPTILNHWNISCHTSDYCTKRANCLPFSFPYFIVTTYLNKKVSSRYLSVWWCRNICSVIMNTCFYLDLVRKYFGKCLTTS